jgi:hypothetical protein
VDCDWLTQALRESQIPDDVSVVGFQPKIIGIDAGFLGEIALLEVQYSSSAIDAPATMILKIPTSSENRQVGQSIGVYEREVRFYTELRQLVNVRTPDCYYGDMNVSNDPEKSMAAIKFINRLPVWMMWTLFRLANWFSGRKQIGFVLLLEDLGNYRVGDQVAGCSVPDAERALRSMAELHAPFWKSPDLTDNPLILPFELIIKLSQIVYSQALPKYLSANEGQISPRNMLILEWLSDNGMTLMESLARSPYSLLHGDFRLDNMFFDDDKDELVLFDWQTFLAGPVGYDLAYFLSASLGEDASDDELYSLREYYRLQLEDKGVSISAERLSWEYEVGMLVVLLRILPVEFQDLVSLGENRGHEIAITWIDRIFVKLKNVDLDRLLATTPYSVQQ